MEFALLLKAGVDAFRFALAVDASGRLLAPMSADEPSPLMAAV
jgi:hypothetical protein